MRKFETRPEVANVLVELGREFRSERYREGFTQAALAWHAEVDQGTISRLERGLAPGLRFATYARLMEILGERRRRAARQADLLEEFWKEHRRPWEIPPQERIVADTDPAGGSSPQDPSNGPPPLDTFP